ncbi:MAG: hypothetical protein H7175_04410 [Burkholderiales bacterium]|nr:hypothetical protein [Anaerolineae bacterium]
MKKKNQPPPALRKQTLRMKDNHTWDAPKGFKIIVLDRGMVSFNIPEKWDVHKMTPVEIYDVPPPDDNTRISVSYWPLPPNIDWTELPLEKLLADSTKEDNRDKDMPKVLERGELVTVKRDDIELAWTWHRWMDATENREAISRFAVSRGWNVAALITFDFWVTDLKKIIPIWREALRSLQLGRIIQDPTRGDVRH